MSAKTKIVVLHMKELIYTAIFVGLGILLVVLLLFMFLPKRVWKMCRLLPHISLSPQIYLFLFLVKT